MIENLETVEIYIKVNFKTLANK